MKLDIFKVFRKFPEPNPSFSPDFTGLTYMFSLFK